MAIFVTGDTHGDFRRFSARAFPERKNLGEDDCVIICGDFGGIWDGGEAEQRALDWLEGGPSRLCSLMGAAKTW